MIGLILSMCYSFVVSFHASALLHIQLVMSLCLIAQDEPDAHLPKIVPSIFQSPGGERFCNLLLAFSTYVLSTIIKAENGELSSLCFIYM